MSLLGLSGAWGKTIPGKNLKQKSRDADPLTIHQNVGFGMVGMRRVNPHL
jgi:hypothetical protein